MFKNDIPRPGRRTSLDLLREHYDEYGGRRTPYPTDEPVEPVPPPPAACEFVHQVWGPHEGCAEFMDEPDTFTCGGPASTRFLLYDEMVAAYGEDPFSTWTLCPEHATLLRDDLATGNANGTSIVLEAPVDGTPLEVLL